MDKIKNRENSGESVHGNRVNNLRFADDIDIIEQSNEKLQDTVDKLHTDVCKIFQNAPFQAKIIIKKVATRCEFRAQKHISQRMSLNEHTILMTSP